MGTTKTLLLVALMAGFLTAGCGGKKRIEGSEIPTQPQSNEVVVPPSEPPPPPVAEAAPTPEPTPVPSDSGSRYIVVKGDTPWDISAMSIAYHDNFQWPLIFKANRDQIKDPDLIYPKQEFLLRHDYSDGDVSKAKKDAINTPKYVPHTKPRETLPVDYF